VRRAFVVGCGAFDSGVIEPLPYARCDAEEFYKLATDPRLGDWSAESVLLVDPGRRELRAALGEFLRKLAPGDEFMLYLAGHASRLRSGQWAFLCRDSVPGDLTLTSFPYSDLRKLILDCSQARGILVFDTCFARSARALREFQSRGAESELRLETPREGFVTLWACGASELTFEKDGHGLLTGWLIEAIRVGAGLDPSNEVVLPAEALHWIKGRLKQSGMAENLWPSLRTSGDVAGLYLARNPRHEPGARPQAEAGLPERAKALQEATTSLVARFGLELEEETLERVQIQELRRDGQACYRLGTTDRDYRLLQPATLRILWQWIKYGASASLLFGFLAGYFFRTMVGFWTGGVCFVAVTLLLWMRTRKILADPRSHFILLTEHGVLDVRGRSDRGLDSLALPWTRYAGSLYRQETTETLTMRWIASDQELKTELLSNAEARQAFPDLTVSAEGYLSLTYSDDEVLSRGGVSRLKESIDWGVDLKDRRVFEPAQPETDKTREPQDPALHRICLVSVSKFDHLPNLAAPPHDVERMRDLFEQADLATPPVAVSEITVEILEDRVAEFLQQATGGTAVFYFAGHGIVWRDELYLALRNTEPARLHETAFPLSRFAELVLERRLHQLVLILDCCFSGVGGESLGLTPQTVSSIEQLFAQERESLTILAASGPREEAHEIGRSGIFTEKLAAIARGLMAEKGQVLVSDLSAALSAELAAIGLQQHHQLFAADSGLGLVLLRARDLASVDSAARKALVADVEKIARSQSERLQTLAEQASSGMLAIQDLTRVVECGRPRYAKETLILLGLGGMGALFANAAVRDPDIGDQVFLWAFALLIWIGALWIARNLFFGDHPRLLFLTEDGIIRLHTKRRQVYPGAKLLTCRLETSIRKESGRETDRTENVRLKMRDGSEDVLATSLDNWLWPMPNVCALAAMYVSFYRAEYKGLAREALLKHLGSITRQM